MQCPRCGSQDFVQTMYEGIPVEKCKVCHGSWLDEGEITQIIAKKEKKFSEELIKETVSMAFSGVPKAEREKQILCPICQSKMNAINYAVSSGIIIDRCPNNHGLWFDNHELEKAQAYREYWQTEVAKHQDDFVQMLKEAEQKPRIKTNRKNSALFTLAEIFSRFF